MESAAARFVRHSRQIPLGQFLDVSGIYGTLFSPGSLFLHSRRLVHCCSAHQRIFIVKKISAWGAPTAGSIAGDPFGPRPRRNSRINHPQPNGRRKPPLAGFNSSATLSHLGDTRCVYVVCPQRVFGGCDYFVGKALGHNSLLPSWGA